MRVVHAVAVLSVSFSAFFAVAAFPAGAVDATWITPVETEVIDHFRPPESRYGPGNRGIEYATIGGEQVRSVADGQVTFAGRVGRNSFVVVAHDDGLRSTYAYVAQVLVVRGQRVVQGEPVAIAGPGFHLTARLGERYLDPSALFAGARPIPHLIDGASFDVPPGRISTSVLAGPLDPLRAMLSAAADLSLTRQLEALADAAATWRQQDCTPDSVSVPAPGRSRVLIQVGGLGSSALDASIGELDPLDLGYSPQDVIGFSYRGGCTPKPFGSSEWGIVPGAGALGHQVTSSDYDAADTRQQIDLSASRLAGLIEDAATARPGQPIDVAAHSLGGVVARRAVEMLAERGRLAGTPGSVSLGVVVTIGSPHQGADLATLGMAIDRTDLARVVDGVTDHRRADSIRQLTEAGLASMSPPGPPPEGVTVVAVAGATDVIVPGAQAIWEGARNVIVPPAATDDLGVHGDLPGRAEVARSLALAVGGMAPACVDLADLVSSTLSSRAISSAEDLGTVILGVGRYVL